MSEKIEDWLEENFANEGTKNMYRNGLKTFYDHTGGREPADSNELARMIKKFVQKKKSELAPKTLNGYTTAVRVYFADQGIDIDGNEWRNIRRRLIPANKSRTVDRAGSPEEWKKIISHMSTQGRSLFLFLLSTGCRVGEALQLRKGDISLDKNPPRAQIRHEYTKGEHAGRTVFMTPEAGEAIKDWLQAKAHVNKRTAKTVILPDGREFKGKEEDPEKIWDFASSTARRVLATALKKAGLNTRDRSTGRYEIHVHSTRKFFRSNCGLDDGLVHALMGHEGYLDDSYLRLDPERAGKEYSTIAAPRLTIFEAGGSGRKEELLKNLAQGLGINRDRIILASMNAAEEGTTEEEAIGGLIKEEFAGSSSQKKQHKVVSGEEQLVEYLNNGWELIREMNGGDKFIVAR